MAALDDEDRLQIQQVFNALDVDGSGTIEAEEVRQGLVDMGYPSGKMTDGLVKSMMESVDADGDGKIDINEFTQLWENNNNGETTGFGQVMFNSLFSSLSMVTTAVESGVSTVSETVVGTETKVKKERTRKRFKGNPVQILFDTLDKDADNTVDSEEFVTLMVVSGVGGGSSFNTDERGARSVMRQFGCDKAGTGILDEDEFAVLMDKMGESMDVDVADLCTMFIEALTPTDDEAEDSD